MQFMILIYNDPALLSALPAHEFDETMRGCLSHADELRQQGHLGCIEVRPVEDIEAVRRRVAVTS